LLLLSSVERPAPNASVGFSGRQNPASTYSNYDSCYMLQCMETKTYTTIDLRKGMGEILDRTRIAGEAAAITRKGKTVAYLVPAEWFEQTASRQQSHEAA